MPSWKLGRSLRAELLKVFPVNKRDVVGFQGLAEFEAGDGLEVALAPGGAEIGVAGGDGLKFAVVVAEVNNHFVDSRAQRGECLDVRRRPRRRRNFGIKHNERI